MMNLCQISVVLPAINHWMDGALIKANNHQGGIVRKTFQFNVELFIYEQRQCFSNVNLFKFAFSEQFILYFCESIQKILFLY